MKHPELAAAKNLAVQKLKGRIILGFLNLLFGVCILSGCGKSATAVPELNEHGKEEIVLCAGIKSIWLQSLVDEYNIQSDRYEVVITECGTDESIFDYRDKIQLQLTSGGGPDILGTVALQNFDMKPYAEKGCLEDLTDFIGEQGGFCEKTLDCVRLDGKLYGLPIMFSLGSLVASQDLTKDMGPCTPERCMQVVEESGIPVFCQAFYGWEADEAGLCVLDLLNVTDLFVDKEKGVSSFDQPEFVDILEFSAKYADPVSQESLGQRLKSNEIAFVGGSIGNFTDFWYFEAAFQGKPDYIGHISPDGGRFSLSADCFYLNSASQHKEGALDFLSFLVSPETQSQFGTNHYYRFPAKKDVLEQLWKQAEAEENIYEKNAGGFFSDGVAYSPRKMTEEEEALFWEMLESSVPRGSMQDDIWDIVEEETLPFFSGEMSAEKVAESTHNRVQLYLDERK